MSDVDERTHLRAIIFNVLGFHQPQNISSIPGVEEIVCLECVTHYKDDATWPPTPVYQPYPCNTVRMLQARL